MDWYWLLLQENVSLFDVVSTFIHRSKFGQTLTLDLRQRPISQPAQSEVIFQLQTCPPSCNACTISTVISSGEALLTTHPTPILFSQTVLLESSLPFPTPFLSTKPNFTIYLPTIGLHPAWVWPLPLPPTSTMLILLNPSTTVTLTSHRYTPPTHPPPP